MKPYYDQDGITIYHGDCRDLHLDTLVPDPMIVTDPPYGINYRSHHNSSRRGKWAQWVRYEDMPGIYGDDKPIDPTPLLALGCPLVIFGGNYLSLPPTRCWIVWNKREGISPNNQADCELAWTNFNKPARIYDHLWSGLLRAGRENVARSEKTHPHQKPVALLRFIIRYSDHKGGVVDPYCGTGATLIAAKEESRPAAGIEIEERYCEIAAKRLSQTVLDFK